MRPPIVRVVLVLAAAVAVALGGRPPTPRVLAADAGSAIVTVNSHCKAEIELPRSWPPDRPAPLRCEAIYRNDADRPVYDIDIDVQIGGQRAEPYAPTAFPNGTRRALLPGERAVVLKLVLIPDGVAPDARVGFVYRAAWTGDARDLDGPRPELQYIDRVDEPHHVDIIAEARNTGRRALDWQWDGNPSTATVHQYPVLAFYLHGALIDAHESGNRVPFDRIGADGRYVFMTTAPDRAFDAVEVFFVEQYEDAGGVFSDAGWELAGLEHRIRTDITGQPIAEVTVRVRNPTWLRTRGPVTVIARRADFHAIGAGSCRNVIAIAPGGEASCVADFAFFQAVDKPPADPITFLTVELSGAVAFPATPTPTATVTPCPVVATPAPVPTLQTVASRLWLPTLIRMLPEWCPAKP